MSKAEKLNTALENPTTLIIKAPPIIILGSA
jgi:hypothetical protein